MNDPQLSPGGDSYAADPVRLADTPGYPLARGVDTADIDTVPYDTGALSIRFGDLALRPLAAPVPEATEVLAGFTKVTYRIPALSLTGRYAIDARPDEISTIDAGGNPFQPLTAEQRQPTFPAAPAARTPPDEQTQQRWHGRARAHREALTRTENGRKLLAEYGKHNDTYCEVFAGSDFASETLRDIWRSGGVTRRMGEHTYSVTDPGVPPSEQQPVNQWTDPADPALTFNAHAWRQRTALVTALNAKADLAEEDDDAEACERYEAAAKAALSFSKEVEQMGNGGRDVAPMTRQQVFQTVEEHSGAVQQPPPEAMAPYRLPTVLGEPGPEGRPGGSAGTTPDGWVELTADDHAVIERFHRAHYRQQAAEAEPADNTLHLGRLTARLDDVRITLRLPAGPGAPAAELEDVEVALPEFDLGVQDEQWEGNAGEVARERLAGMTFLLGLLRDAMAEALRHSVLAGMPGFALPAQED
ncbi:hypothetical protein [Streptomyces sp. NPDC018947]|uniref:hypothetical protein n=1 Tax=Streptomyces sp. NPDC018947 TaxID=3365054 RepID=UPI0037878A8F